MNKCKKFRNKKQPSIYIWDHMPKQ